MEWPVQGFFVRDVLLLQSFLKLLMKTTSTAQ